MTMGSKSISLIIDGERIDGRSGQTVLEVMREHDMPIPHICYHPNLGPIQTCDTCIVEIDGQKVRACGTPVTPGMRVRTALPEVKAAQKEAMDRILQNHELYCTVCDYNNGTCEIHNTVKSMGIEEQSTPFQAKPYEVDASNPFYRYDPDQCILCGRCVEVCQDVQVNETLSIDWSLDQPRVIWDDNVAINESSCVSCGQCVTVCPCNALMEKSMLGEAGHLTGIEPETMRPLIELTKKVETGYSSLMAISDAEAAMRENRIKKTKTVCTYCGVGCSFDVWTKGRNVLKIDPQGEAPVNGISTCIKGKFGWDYVNSEERLTKPLIREGDHFREAAWDEAIQLIAERLSHIKAAHGADATGFISSSKCTNEESYLMQKFARAVIGTNNIDNCSRYCQSPATMGLFRTVGYGGDSGSIDDIAQADLVIAIGTNTAESHPVLASRVKRAQKLHEQKLIVSDLRKHEMAQRADLFLHPKAGTDLVWLSAVTKYLIEQGWHDQVFLSERVNGFEAYVESLRPFTLAYAEEVTGLPAEEMKQVARAIHEADKVCILWAMGVTQQQRGSDTSTAISNLLLVSGQYGRPGTGAYPLRGHNNVQGASDFGSMPNYFPGYEPVTDDDVRRRYERGWGVTLSGTPGLNNHTMVDAIHDGRLKALYIIGEDMGIVDANINYVQAAFEKLDFLVVQDLFFTKTAEYADVILPASASLEKEGTFTNTERRIQRLYQAMEPLEGTKPDWQILCELANAMGADWNYSHPSDVMAEAAALAPLFAGVTYERLEGYGSLQWPVAEDGTDSPLLYTERFNFSDGKARLFPLKWDLPRSDDETYDLHVNNGRLLEHFHEGNMTYKVPGIKQKTPRAFVEISPQLAAERGVKDGTLVRLESPYGAVRVQALITDRVKGNELYLPMNDAGEAAINRLTSSEVDDATDTPAYKDVSVKMEVLKDGSGSPLPRINHRYGNPRPQIGVNVEEKWKRADYRFPGETALKDVKARG